MPSPPQNRRRSRFRERIRRAAKSLIEGWDFYLFAVGYGIVLGLLGVAALAFPVLESEAIVGFGDLAEALPPGDHHWFGTNRDGVDLLAPVFAAAGRSVWLVLVATVLGSVFGLALATVICFLWRERGYRWLERLSGAVGSLPAMFLLFVFAAGYGAGTRATMGTLGALAGLFVAGRAGNWYRDLENQGDVLAARALGFSRGRILVEQLLPRLWPRVAACAATLLPAALLAEAGLGFSGAGATVAPAEGRLGAFLGAGHDALFDLPWLLWWPGVVLAVLTIVLASLAWAVRRTLDQPIDERIF